MGGKIKILSAGSYDSAAEHWEIQYIAVSFEKAGLMWADSNSELQWEPKIEIHSMRIQMYSNEDLFLQSGGLLVNEDVHLLSQGGRLAEDCWANQ